MIFVREGGYSLPDSFRDARKGWVQVVVLGDGVLGEELQGWELFLLDGDFLDHFDYEGLDFKHRSL